VTYLLDGEIMHRDSLGTVQPIRPGAVNWMTAGRGIVHSERTAPERRASGGRLYGLQSWVALPQRHEETAPAFAHHAADALPVIDGEGKTVRLIAGALYGARSPVATLSELFYCRRRAGAGRAPRGPGRVGGARRLCPRRRRLRSRARPTIRGSSWCFARAPRRRCRRRVPAGSCCWGARDGRRAPYLVEFRLQLPERIEQAKADWRADRFPAVPGETERIPLPE